MGSKCLLTLLTIVYKSARKMFRFHMIANIIFLVVTEVVADVTNKFVAVEGIFYNKLI